MTNRKAEKIRRRRENLLADKTPAVVPRSNNLWFWILFVVLLSTTAYLVYQSATNNAVNEMIIPIIISIIAFLVVIVWFLPKFYVRSLPNEAGADFDREKERLKLEDDTRKTIAQIVGGAVILGSLLFTYNTFRLQQEGQITDRFTKAVAQLGDDKLEIRLGGLYALERIAKDSAKDHWTVMEILSAFIRENSKKLEVSEQNKSIESANENTNKPKQNIEITTDIQAALTIIGRRKVEQDSHTDEIDLRGANLPEVDLSEADLSKADLGVTYEGTEFFRLVHSTNLKAANLIKTNLEFANLPFVDLQFADLRFANLRSANLSLAKLKCAKFGEADLYQTNIQDADLSCADLRRAKNITFEQLRSAKIDKNTLLPEYLEERKLELLEHLKK